MHLCARTLQVELETVEKLQLVEWFANNYKNFGATLEFVTNRSQEGSQFVKVHTCSCVNHFDTWQ